MSISERIAKSLETSDLKEFTELVNTSSQYINDIFANGLLHHMLSKYPDLSMEFYKVVIDNPNTNLNIYNPNILPPILRTNRGDIIDLLLSKPALNVNVVFSADRCLATYAIDENNVSLLEKLATTGRLDITQLDVFNYAMSKNIDAFRILLGLLEPHMCNSLKPVDHAIRTNKSEALDLLLTKGCSINNVSIKELVNTGSGEMVNILVKHLPKLVNKKFILGLAINNNNIELLRAVGKFTSDIEYDDIYTNLDKQEIMDEVVHLANDKNDQELIRTLFMAIVKSKNPKYYLLLNGLNVNKKVFLDVVTVSYTHLTLPTIYSV